MRRFASLQADLLTGSTDHLRLPLSPLSLLAEVGRTDSASPRPACLDAVPFIYLWWPGASRLAELAVPDAPGIDTAAVHAGLAEDAARLLSDTLTPLVGDEYLRGVDTALLLRGRLGIPRPGDAGGFARFVARMRAGRLDELLAHPSVADRVHGAVGGWLTSTLETLLRISADLDVIAKWSGAPSPLVLTRLHTGLGDPHNGGRTVCRADFRYEDRSAPDSLRIAYKPRDVRPEAAFREMARLVCVAADVDPPRTPRVLRRGESHGYTEWIDRNDLRPDLASAALRGLGRLLAVLYLCRAEDCHYENFVCDGSSLVPVDLEALSVPTAPDTRAVTLAGQLHVAQSVLRTGVLPQWSRIEEGRFIDTSLLGMLCTDIAVSTSEDWVHPNTDSMHWGTADVEVHRPACSAGPGLTVENLRREVPTLVAGFREVLRPLIRQEVRQAVLDTLRGLGRFPVRRVHRPTRIYSLLLRETTAPEAMLDERVRRSAFEKLAALPLPTESAADADMIVATEINQLSGGDVPYFSEIVDPDADSTDGWRSRIQGLTPDVIEFNAAVVTAAMTSRFPGEAGDDRPEPSRPPMTALVGLRTIPATELLEPESPDWSLYDGLWGTALLRGRDDPEVSALVSRALEPGRLEHWIVQAGPGLAGTGGLLRVLGCMTTPEELTPVARRILGRYDDALVSTLDNPEFLYGAAGLLRPLTDLASGRFPVGSDVSALARELVDAVTTRILALQDPQSGGWTVPGLPRQLCGFSHGAAGIMAALAIVRSPIRGIDEAIHAALDFENQLFDRESGNWRDLRYELETEQLAANSWCHGAAGIVMSRALLAHYRHETGQLARRALSDLGDGLDRATDSRRPVLDTLCCGAAGRAATATVAADHLDATGKGGHGSVRLRAAASLHSDHAAANPTPRCSVRPDHARLAAFQPGFMTGTTGVRYARTAPVGDFLW